MKSAIKSKNHQQFTKLDLYSINLKAIWQGAKSEHAAFWWLCVCIIFEYVRPQNLFPAIDILPWAQLSLILACITAFTDKQIKWVSNPGNFLLIILLAVILISSVLAFKPSVAFEDLFIFLNWVILYFLIITVVNTEQKFFLFMLVFFLVNFKMSQFGARDFASRGFSYAKWGTSGAPGWFRDAGDLGIQMTIFFPMSLAFVLALRKYWGKYQKLFFYLMPLTALLTLIATSARGPQLGLLAGAIWFLVYKRNFRLIIFFTLFGSLVYSLLPDEMLQEYDAAGEDATSRQRLALWAFGMSVVRDHPVLGVGYENWIDYCNFQNPVGPDLSHCMVAHNSYITAVAETGLVGLTLYILLAIFMLLLNYKTRKYAAKIKNKFLGYMTIGFDVGLISYLVGTIFFTVVWYPLFWIHLAMVVALHEITKRQAIMDEMHNNST